MTLFRASTINDGSQSLGLPLWGIGTSDFHKGGSWYEPIPGCRLLVLMVSLKRYLVSGMLAFPDQFNHFSAGNLPEAGEYQNLAGKPQSSKSIKFNTLLTHQTKAGHFGQTIQFQVQTPQLNVNQGTQSAYIIAHGVLS